MIIGIDCSVLIRCVITAITFTRIVSLPTSCNTRCSLSFMLFFIMIIGIDWNFYIRCVITIFTLTRIVSIPANSNARCGLPFVLFSIMPQFRNTFRIFFRTPTSECFYTRFNTRRLCRHNALIPFVFNVVFGRFFHTATLHYTYAFYKSMPCGFHFFIRIVIAIFAFTKFIRFPADFRASGRFSFNRL